MKAAFLSAPKTKAPLTIGEVAKPQPAAGQVLLRVRACGVCRTDLHIVEAELPQILPKVIPGHQIVGDVVDGETAELPVGARVGVSWVGGTDGSCWYCKHGMENLCDAPTFTGYSVKGGYAEYVVARQDFVFPLPRIWTIYMRLRCCAQGSSGFGVCGWRELNAESEWDCLASDRLRV